MYLLPYSPLGLGHRREMRVAQFAVEGDVDEHDFSWRLAQACAHSIGS